jgi:hypothetical protein
LTVGQCAAALMILVVSGSTMKGVTCSTMMGESCLMMMPEALPVGQRT